MGWERAKLAVPGLAAVWLVLACAASAWAEEAVVPGNADTAADTVPLPTPEEIAEREAQAEAARLAAIAASPHVYKVWYDRWTAADEKGYGEFVTAIGESGCRTVDACIRHPANPFRASDPKGVRFRADCADLPYFLRAYYAWKRGLPFSFESAVGPRGRTRDIRYTASGNRVTGRTDVLSGRFTGLGLLDTLRGNISSAMYRIHPELEEPLIPDLYSADVGRGSIRPGTVVYDPNGHLAVVYKVEPDGRILYIDSHPDNSLTRGTYDRRFVRARPGMGAGFKNWRPVTLVGATRAADGSLEGGRMVLAKNSEIPDHSLVQFYGNGERPSDSHWERAVFELEGEIVDYYDYVRAQVAGGSLKFEPVRELENMVRSNCADIHYRVEAVDLAISAGIHRKAQPSRLPPNIYGTEGEWEIYSTPSRDARLKTAFKELRDQVERFVRMHREGDPKIVYAGHDLIGDLIAAYDRETSACEIVYRRTDGSEITLPYEEIRRRLFLLSFDPYHCIERRWGATGDEANTCTDGLVKTRWYMAEQFLRNQLDRTYEARMDFTVGELNEPGPGRGVATAPDVDVRGYLLSVRSGNAIAAEPGGSAPVSPATGAASPAL